MIEPAPLLSDIYNRIYHLNLVYESGCWQQCGDAHCCSFSRHKAKFRLLAKGAGQELPLLPGEFEFMQQLGWTEQFQHFERRTFDYDFGSGTVTYDTIFSTRPHCACDHDTRTTVCRLYPLLPTYAVDGKVTGAEALGIYEELEKIDQVRPACAITALPFDQINLFMDIANTLASHPALLFHLKAYHLAKHHIKDRIQSVWKEGETSAFALFERSFMRRRLFDHDHLKAALEAMWQSFAQHYGNDFLELNHTPTRERHSVALTR